MVNIEYANAYAEMLEILKYISKEDYDKIPKRRIHLFETNANRNHVFRYNPNLTLDEQHVSLRTKYIIAILFRDYWATEQQREKILKKEKWDMMKAEEEKKEKYNQDNIFHRSNISHTIYEENIPQENNALIEVKENIFIKIVNKIKKFFLK